MTKTTEIPFSNSLALANEFAVKLLLGLLNVRTSYSEPTLVEVSHTNDHFTTQRMAEVRAELSRFRPSRIEATDAQADPESRWSRSEVRYVTIYAREGEKSEETLIAIFDIHRDYLDGDNAEGWTRWRVRNVHVFLTDVGTKLIPEYINRDDPEPIWGTRVL